MFEQDFHPSDNDADSFLSDPYCWQLVEIVIDGTVMFSVSNMSVQEIQESIIDDALAITMWEKAKNEKLNVDVDKFLRHCPRQYVEMIKTMIDSDPLVAPYLDRANGQIRIRDNKEILQAAMDFCGVFYGDFKPTNASEPLYTLNRENVQNMIHKHGGIDNLAKAMLMEIEAGGQQTSKLLN